MVATATDPGPAPGDDHRRPDRLLSRLDPDDFDTFPGLLDRPPPPGEGLLAPMRRSPIRRVEG